MKVLEVGAGRLERWCVGFVERHGGPLAVARQGGALTLTASDGAVATMVPPFPLPDGRPDGPPNGAVTLHEVLAWVAAPRRCAVLLVRRGGYACALVDTGRPRAAAVTVSKVGSRYVQARTAAGGWSQQRFARRRENQARDLVRAVVDVAARLLVPGPADWLVTGGDRPLVESVLSDPRLRSLAALPRGPHLAVGDPRSGDVRTLPDRLIAVRVTVGGPGR
jgi:hypothetical protein